MSSGRDEGPVYYREIQKNSYLKRIPNDLNTSKLRPLGHKKPPLKAMWTLFCVHNGRTPFLEQYPEAEGAATMLHRPAWRACLRGARHVTASVKPRAGDEYDFLVDTDHGPVRMLAPDWDTMQEWVRTLREKLHELRIVSPGENVYAAAPTARSPRAAARDPTSPLPPTPPVPLHRVPGIELNTPIIRPMASTDSQESASDAQTSSQENVTTQNTIPPANSTTTLNTTTSITNTPNTFTSTANNTTQNPVPSSITNTQSSITNPQSSINVTQSSIDIPQCSINSAPNSIILPAMDVDISNWDTSFSSLPSTSHEKVDPKKSVAKICGQNICLDDSILKRNVTDSDEEFFAEIDRIHESVEELGSIGEYTQYKQRVVVGENQRVGLARTESVESSPQRSNVTVIQVSNKGPPHTAIPVLGPDTDVFDFNFKQKLKVTPDNTQDEFINIVNTETQICNTENGYGTVFTPTSEYGHLSLTTTVNVKATDGPPKVTDVKVTDGVYERLCLASTSNTDRASPLSVRRVKTADKARKSSLPNLELAGESAYEYLFPNSNNTTVAVNTERQERQGASENHSNAPVDTVQSRVNSEMRVPNAARANVDVNARVVRSNVERSHSQNAYDGLRQSSVRRVQNDSPKREAKIERQEPAQPKPIWKRGLTELSLLSKLRGFGQNKRQESPSRNEGESAERAVTSPAKVVHRSRPEARIDSSRRRSNSLSNGHSPQPYTNPGLQPLRTRQAVALRAEQRRGACVPVAVPTSQPPVLCEHEKQLWVARWGRAGARCGGRAGDRVAGVAGAQPASLGHARALLKARTQLVDVLFHRVPLGLIYVINRRDNEGLGIKLDSECTVTSVESDSPAARVGLPPPGKWCITEVNNRPINLVKGGEEEITRLCSHGTEVSVLIQPAALVKKIRSALKASKPLLGIR